VALVGRNYSSDKYRYGFNGEEKSDEIYGEGNAYDFGERILDPRIGRWLSLDPELEKFPGSSPYNYAFCNPIAFYEEAGASPISVFAKQIIKKGIKVAVKEAIEAIIKKTVEKYAGKGVAKFAKQVGSDGLEILGTLDQAWWEYAVELIPIAGDAFGAGKLTGRVTDVWKQVKAFEKRAEKFGQLIHRYGEDAAKKLMSATMTTLMQGKGKLRKALNLTDKALEAHHLIPVQLLTENRLVQDAIAGGFDFNGLVNGIGVAAGHGPHKEYTGKISAMLDQFSKSADYSPEKAKEILEGFTNKLKQQVQKEVNEGGKKLDELIIK